jgi:hypothetical protein
MGPLVLSLAVVAPLAQDAGAAAAQPAAVPRTGAVALFDGKTLAGWTTAGGRYDGPARWTVEDGCLVGRTTEAGEGGLIYTDRCYHSFDLELSVQMDWPFDSGVFLRMLPPASGRKGLQVTLDHRPGGEIVAVYADGLLEHNEAGAVHYRRGEWNRVRVRAAGGARCHVQAWVNGQQVTDYRLPADAAGFAESGRIGLQVHGGEPSRSAVRFKDLVVRELPVFDSAEFAIDERSELRPLRDFLPLFAGGGLEAFEQPVPDGFVVRDRLLALLAGHGARALHTRADFADFELRLDFALAPGADTGLLVRAARGPDGARSGCEVEIRDDHQPASETDAASGGHVLTGSVRGAPPPAVRDALYPAGCWNTLEVLLQGPRLRTRLNGFTLHDVQLDGLVAEAGQPSGARARTGFLAIAGGSGLAAGGVCAWFKNVFVRRLE